MSDLVTVTVNCRRDGKLIAAYPISYAVTLGPSAPPSRESFIAEAKANLTNEGLARPPYEGIQFEVVRR
jgi:hypothetical protein